MKPVPSVHLSAPVRWRHAWRVLTVGLAVALGLRSVAAASAVAASGAPSPSAEAVLELRRGDRTIPPGGHDLAPPTGAEGPREQTFRYTLANRGAEPVHILPLLVRRALNCRVTSTAEPAVDLLAPGAALTLTVRITPGDRGPWRAALVVSGRIDEDRAPETLAWDIAAPGP